ncbi:MAG: DUF3224 domain-containing protein [Rubrivivax sp.]|nr:DUF3224 domain-containing protein [Rubrivivax sp.]
MNTTACGTFVVRLSPLPFEGDPGQPAQATGAGASATLARLEINKQIEGDLVATTRGQMLSAVPGMPGSAGYVAMELVDGALHGRRGSFVLQHSGTMSRGTPQLAVTVVPDSATGELQGLAGTFRIIVAGGQHRYEFDYTLP